MKRYIYRFFALLTTALGAWAFAGCADDGDTLMTEESGCFNLVVTVPNESPTRATDAELGFNEFKVKTLHFYFYNDAASESVYDYVWTKEEFNTRKELTVPLPSSAFLDGGIFGDTSTSCIVYAVANVDEATLPDGPQTIDNLKATVIGSSFDTTETQPSFAMDGQATVTLDRKGRKATGEISLERAAAKITLSVNLPETITVKINQADGTTADRVYTSRAASMHVWIGNGVKNSKLNTAAGPVEETDLYSNEITTLGTNGTGFTYDAAMEKYKYVQNVPFYSYPNKWEATSPDGNCYLTLVLPWSYTDAAGNTQPITTYYRIAVQPKECKIERNMHYDIRVTIGRLGGSEPQKPVDVESWTYAVEWKTQTLDTDIKEIRYLLLNNNYYDSTIKNPDGSTGAYKFEMNNTTNIEIPFGTSHETIIESVTLSWYDYSVNPFVKRELPLTTNGTYKYSSFDGYNSSTDFAGIIIDNGGNTGFNLKLKRDMLHIGYGEYKWVEEYEQIVEAGTGSEHTITIAAHDEWVPGNEPNITKYAAINAYTFDIVLRHKDDENRKANVRVTQYPDIYITAQLTPAGTRFVNNNYSVIRKDQDPPTYAYTSSTRPSNGKVTTDDHWEYYMGDLWETGNNKNTYIISISKFSDSNNNSDQNPNDIYIIADPRERTVNNFPILDSDNPDSRYDTEQSPARWSVNDNSGRGLENYYPTDDSADKARYIAPKLRIASQWGMSKTMTFEGAKRRCASYQENGRPAGRWRLPTIAEVEYIARLSNKGFIPYLFGDPTRQAGTFFCGSGIVTVDNRRDKPTVTSSAVPFDATAVGSVRCVYDEWYWGNDTLTNKNVFTWGDRERSISRN